MNKKSLATIIATVGGAGYAPIAPGTFGALVAVGVYCLLCQYCHVNFTEIIDTGWTTNINQHCSLYVPIFIVVGIATFIKGLWASNVLEAYWGKDASKIVIDEFVGQWITLFLVPYNFYYILAAFILFRFFDILKPFGIRQIDEKMKGGMGVMMDDVLAGIYAVIVLNVGSVLWVAYQHG